MTRELIVGRTKRILNPAALLEASGDSEPPHSIAEQVLDYYDMDGCRPLP